MYKHGKLLAIILSLFLVGCAPKMVVMLDGRPIPQYSYTLTNPETGIQVRVTAANVTYVDEDGEKILWPEYVSVNDCVDIDVDKSATFDIMVQVKNLNKAYYKIKQLQLTRPILGNGETNVANSLVYAGHLRYNTVKLSYVLNDNTYNKIDITVENENNLMLMSIGSFIYKVKHKTQSLEEGG